MSTPLHKMKHRLQSPDKDSGKIYKPVSTKSPMPSPRAGSQPIAMWNLTAKEKHKKLGEDEWLKILKSCNAPIGFTHNDLSLYPKVK